MQWDKILDDATLYITDLFRKKNPAEMKFHNVKHVFEVFHAVQIIGAEENISDEEMMIVKLAALFHDCGYVQTYIGHETVSMEFARKFLEDRSIPETMIIEVEKAIDATKYPQRPHTKCAEILCDADLYHFTKPDYPHYAAALRKEYELFLGKTYTDAEWNQANYEFMTQHSFFTRYGNEVLQSFKSINEKIIQSRLKTIKINEL